MRAATELFGRTSAPSRFAYSKEDRASVCKIEGSRAKSTVKIQSSTASASYRYLFMQIRHRSVEDFTITITLRDDRRNRFNFAFSTVTRKSDRPTSSQTSALVHFDIPNGVWVTVIFDLQQVGDNYWRPAAFHQLDSIEIAPVCTLARVFSQDSPPALGNDGRLIIPKPYAYPSGMDHVTVLIPVSEPDTDLPERVETAKPPPLSKPNPKPRTTQKKLSNGVKPPNVLSQKSLPIVEEDDPSDDGAFGGVAPSISIPPVPNVSRLPDNDEDELELVYIESLGCYYCPSNQQYYQIDDQ
jgi:hypothetical protein